jgi:heme exporter protein D
MRRKIITALVYASTAFAFAMYFDSLYGAGPVTHGLWFINLATVGMALFAAACILSFFALRTGFVCAAAGGLLSWPAFAVAMFKIPWGRIVSILPYSNWLDLSMAIVTLIVSSVYSVSQARSLFRGREEVQSRNSGLRLVAALAYAVGVFFAAYWRGIWDWFFRLRYGG